MKFHGFTEELDVFRHVTKASMFIYNYLICFAFALINPLLLFSQFLISFSPAPDIEWLETVCSVTFKNIDNLRYTRVSVFCTCCDYGNCLHMYMLNLELKII